MSKTAIIFTFSLGAAVGSIVTWKLMKSKCDRLIQEEIDSFKDAFVKRVSNDDVSEEKDYKEAENAYEEVLEQTCYSADSDIPEKKGGNMPMNRGKITIITPEEFGELYDEYDAETLTYYSDGVLTDASDEIIDNAEDMVGDDWMNHFGDFPDDPDSVYVRNDAIKTDFEILRDDSKYFESRPAEG